MNLLNKLHNYIQNGPMGNDLQYGGTYGGPDEEYGWKYSSPLMKEHAERATEQWASKHAAFPEYTPYGIGEQLQEMDFSWGFDPTSAESIAEALAKQEFYDVARESYGEQGGGIYSYGDVAYNPDVKRTAARPSKDVYSQVGEEDVARMYEDYRYGRESSGFGPSYGPDIQNIGSSGMTDAITAEMRAQGASETEIDNYIRSIGRTGGQADMDLYLSQAKTGVLTEEELAQLSSGHKMWRRMEDPAIAEAGDVYRGGLSQIMANLGGGIRTGSAARRRQELMQDYSRGLVGVRSKTRGKRREHGEALTERLRGLFT